MRPHPALVVLVVAAVAAGCGGERVRPARTGSTLSPEGHAGGLLFPSQEALACVRRAARADGGHLYYVAPVRNFQVEPGVRADILLLEAENAEVVFAFSTHHADALRLERTVEAAEQQRNRALGFTGIDETTYVRTSGAVTYWPVSPSADPYADCFR